MLKPVARQLLADRGRWRVRYNTLEAMRAFGRDALVDLEHSLVDSLRDEDARVRSAALVLIADKSVFTQEIWTAIDGVFRNGKEDCVARLLAGMILLSYPELDEGAKRTIRAELQDIRRKEDRSWSREDMGSRDNRGAGDGHAADP